MDDRLADADHGSGMVGGHPVGDHLAGEDHGFDTEDGHLVDDRLADAGHDSGMVGGHPVDDHLVGEDHGFDRADARLADDHPVGVGRDFGMGARLAGLDRVAELHVSLYRRHRAHTSYGIRLGWHPARGVGAGHGFGMDDRHLVDDHPAGVGHGFGKADGHLVDDHFEGDLLADEDHDSGMEDGHPVDAADAGHDCHLRLQRGFQNYHHVGRRCKDAFRQMLGVRHVEYECPDVRHRLPSGH